MFHQHIKAVVLFSLHVSLIALLTACSGGGGVSNPTDVGSDEQQRSTFSPIVINGLGYVTENESGVTDENFSLLPNSGLVELFLGDISIATVDTSTDTRFTSAFLDQIPDTAEALLFEVRNTELSSSFDRLINTLTLLALLDRDQNISNGIDLDNLNNLIDGYEFSLSVPMEKFLEQYDLKLLLDRYEAPTFVDYREIIVALYKALGIKIPSSRIQKITESGNNRLLEIFYGYDVDGRIESREVVVDGDEESKAVTLYNAWRDSLRVNTASHTHNGTTYSLSIDYDDDGREIYRQFNTDEENSIYEIQYNSLGQKVLETSTKNGSQVTRTDYFFNSLGQNDHTQQDSTETLSSIDWSHEYDDGGLKSSSLRTKVTTYSTPAMDSITLSEVTRISFSYNNGLLQRESVDFNNDQVVENTTEYEYDSYNNVRRKTVFNALGSVDRIEEWTYSRLGQLEMYQLDANGDGFFEERNDNEYRNGLLYETVKQAYAPNDVEPQTTESIRYSYRTSLLNDGLSNLLIPETGRIPLF